MTASWLLKRNLKSTTGIFFLLNRKTFSIKIIGDNDDSIYCDNCNLPVLIKCDNLNFIDYQYLNGNDDPWFCLKCNSEFCPFGTLNNKTFNQYINSNNIQNKEDDEENFSNLVLKPPINLNCLFSQFNSSSQIHDFKLKTLKMLPNHNNS